MNEIKMSDLYSVYLTGYKSEGFIAQFEGFVAQSEDLSLRMAYLSLKHVS